MTTHIVERTSPKGGPFIGTCALCGATGLTPRDALEECRNPGGLTEEQALLQAVEGPRVEDEIAKAVLALEK